MPSLRGETVRFQAVMTDRDGALQNVDGAMLTIYDPTMTSQGSFTMGNPATGSYVGSYTLASDAIFGNWVAEVAGTSSGVYDKTNRVFEVGALS